MVSENELTLMWRGHGELLSTWRLFLCIWSVTVLTRCTYDSITSMWKYLVSCFTGGITNHPSYLTQGTLISATSARLPFTSAVITATVLAHAVGYQATNSVAKQQVCHMKDAWRRVIKIDVVKLKAWLVICSIVLSALCDLWQDEMCTVCVFTNKYVV